MLPSAALDRARQLDEYYLTHSCPVGPLHGLPISVPEDTVIRNPRSRDRNGSACSNKMSEVIDTLWKAGVVLYARTAQSQTLVREGG